jgi:peptidyl-tRNA hydrolase, PTH1 family
MWLIVGLGNPGRQYELTRHNIGFIFNDFLSRALQLGQEKSEHKALTNKFRWKDQEVLIAKPQTFMNLSGDSVRSLVDFYKISTEQIIVVHDEIDLPGLSLKLQKKRGHGGHNGIRDITEKLGTNEYLRVRLGVGRPSHPEMLVSDYVLQKFSTDELAEMTNFMEHSLNAVQTIIFDGFEKAANRFNILQK